eukprot:PhM_4_TR12812/c0_g1_i1/m.72752
MIELFITYIQFYSLIVTIPGVPFPDRYVDVGTYLSVFNLDYNFFTLHFPQLPTEFRTTFISVVVLVPFVVALFVVLMLAPKKVLWWYLVLLAGTAAFTASVFTLLLSLGFGVDDDDLAMGRDSATYPSIFAALVLVLCFVAYWVAARREQQLQQQQQQNTVVDMQQKGNNTNSTTYNNSNKSPARRRSMFDDENDDNDDDNDNAPGSHEARKIAYVRAVPVKPMLETLAYCAVCVVGGLILIGIAISVSGGTSALGNLSSGVGYALLGLGGVLFVWLVLYLFPAGRSVQYTVRRVVRTNFMRVSLIILSVMYIPISSKVVKTFNCNYFECAPGMQLSRYNVTAATSVNDTQCEPCLGFGAACSAFEPCPGVRDWLLEYDRDVKCDELQVYFWPASGIMVVAFMLGIPYLFYYLIRTSTQLLAANSVVGTSTGKGQNKRKLTELEIWSRQVRSSSCVSLFLFDAFELPWRYWQLFLIGQKFLVVTTTVYIVRGTGQSTQGISLVATLVIHSIMLLLNVRTAPYIDDIEDRVAGAMQLCLTLTATVGIVLYNDAFSIPDEVLFALLLLNAVLPLCVLALGLIMAWYQKRKIDQADEREQQRLDALAAEASPSPQAKAGSGTTPSKAGNSPQPVVSALKGTTPSSSTSTSNKTVVVAQPPTARKGGHEKRDSDVVEITSPIAVGDARGSLFVQDLDSSVTRDPVLDKDGNPVVEEDVTLFNMIEHHEEFAAGPPAASVNRGKSMYDDGDGDEDDSDFDSDDDDLDFSDLSSSDDGEAQNGNGDGDGDDTQKASDMTGEESAVLQPPDPTKGDETQVTPPKRKVPPQLQSPGDTLAAQGSAGSNGVIISPPRRQRRKSAQRERARRRKQRLEQMQFELDQEINERALSTMRWYFLSLGVACTCALALCVLGVLASTDPLSLSQIASGQRLDSFTGLAGYADWSNFTASCCCVVSSNQSSVEQWICENGRRLDRQREGEVFVGITRVPVNGLRLRSLCGTTFVDGCTIDVKSGVSCAASTLNGTVTSNEVEYS